MLEILFFWCVVSFGLLALNIAGRSIYGRLAGRKAVQGPATLSDVAAHGGALSAGAAEELGRHVLKGMALVNARHCHFAALKMEAIGPEGMSGFNLVVSSDQLFNEVLKPHLEAYFRGDDAS